MGWTRGQTLGRGSTATVSIATDDQSGEVFAVKSAELSNSEFLKREQRVLSTLMCPQIVAYKGYSISSENGKFLYNLFLEYAPGGTLIDAIRRRGGGLDEARIRSYTRAMLQGLQYLHSNGMVHCDIKGQNVLVTSDGAKIADLGCAKRVDEVSSSDWCSTMTISGTPIYMAPEVARGEGQDFPADVWALGCTVIEMATGQPPWVNVSDPVSALYRIGFSSDVPEIPRFMSKQAQDFLDKCLQRDPVKRWSASELLKHDFVNEPNSFLTHINTPTSVLDQGFWNTIEGLETTWSSTHKTCSSSPDERIRKLSEGNSSSLSEMINWAWDDTWVTVRSNDSKEVTSGETIWASEEYNLDIPDEPISSSEINTTCSSNNSRHERCSLGLCKCTNDILWSIPTLINKELCHLIIHSLLLYIQPTAQKSTLTLVFCPPIYFL